MQFCKLLQNQIFSKFKHKVVHLNKRELIFIFFVSNEVKTVVSPWKSTLLSHDFASKTICFSKKKFFNFVKFNVSGLLKILGLGGLSKLKI